MSAFAGFTHPKTNAQMVGPIIPGEKQPTPCRPCTKRVVDAWLAEPEDKRGPEPRIQATMFPDSHRKWVHPDEPLDPWGPAKEVLRIPAKVETPKLILPG